MTKWPHDPWLHRDGLLLHNPQFHATVPTSKTDGRGTTRGQWIYLGEADLTVFGQPRWLGVIAFREDIHHTIMTPELLRRHARACEELADRV